MTDAREPVTVLAPAKVNLTLEVLARRPDGFHDLRSTFLALDLCDRVSARTGEGESGEVSLTVIGPEASADIPTDSGNLVHRAASLALERIRDLDGTAPPPLALELDKHIPSEAGLGGGSSDAAATLTAVELWSGRDLGVEWRTEVLAQLGSDCVFFEAAKETGAALCEGRGELVTPLNPPTDWHVALLVPAVRCSTREVFECLEIPTSTPVPSSTFQALLDQEATDARAGLLNHLEDAAAHVEPAVNEWRIALHSTGLEHFHLSGSGSSFFGLYSDPEQGQWDLAAATSAARGRGLQVRLACMTRPSGHGSLRVDS